MKSRHFQADVEKQLKRGMFRLTINVFELDSEGLVEYPALIFRDQHDTKFKDTNEWSKSGSHTCDAYFENIDDALKFVDEVRIELNRLDELKEAKLRELEMIPT